jgi:hypothetical protein
MAAQHTNIPTTDTILDSLLNIRPSSFFVLERALKLSLNVKKVNELFRLAAIETASFQQL